jgi:thiamine biosynthesis lipoprotein ApbE
VLGPKHGLALVEKTPEADALLVTKDGRTLRSRNFPFAS